MKAIAKVTTVLPSRARANRRHVPPSFAIMRFIVMALPAADMRRDMTQNLRGDVKLLAKLIA